MVSKPTSQVAQVRKTGQLRGSAGPEGGGLRPCTQTHAENLPRTGTQLALHCSILLSPEQVHN
jgi:hypothetical protein